MKYLGMWIFLSYIFPYKAEVKMSDVSYWFWEKDMDVNIKNN